MGKAAQAVVVSAPGNASAGAPKKLAAVKTEWTKDGEVLEQKKLHQASDTIEKAQGTSNAIERAHSIVSERGAFFSGVER
jgi:hypothetical protein